MNIELTSVDRTILESYKIIVEGLADYLGEGCEVVLHSLENLDHSVIKIVNGTHTGRREGSPITDLALSILNNLTDKGEEKYESYFSKNKKGEPLKASTILIHGEEGRVIALLCINYYLNTPLSQFMPHWSRPDETATTAVRENFAESTRELVLESVDRAEAQVRADQSLSTLHKNRRIVELLEGWGIFKLKDAVNIVASHLGISKNTVYLHLRNLRG